MNLSIIVPVYNECSTIVGVLERLQRSPCGVCEWIVVDDGSTDGTTELLGEHVPSEQVCVLKPTNEGKTAAVRTGLNLATRDWVIVQDADLEYDPHDIAKLYQLATSSKTQPVAIYGQRPGCWTKPGRWPFAIGVLLIDVWLLLLYRRWVRDHATCYKLVPREVLQDFDLGSSGFEGCVEITARLMQRRVPIMRLPISYAPRTIRQGKKLNAAYWFTAVRSAWRFRLGH